MAAFCVNSRQRMLMPLRIAPACWRNDVESYSYLRSMNNKQRDKHIVYFARQWLEEVLTMCRKTKGFLYHMRTSGHMSYRKTLFNISPGKVSIEDYLRIEINLAMIDTEDDYLRHWTDLGKMIYQFASEYGDLFNEQYAKQQKPKKHIS